MSNTFSQFDTLSASDTMYRDSLRAASLETCLRERDAYARTYARAVATGENASDTFALLRRFVLADSAVKDYSFV